MSQLFVISLPEATQRRQHVARQLDRPGVEYQFFDAVDGRKGEHPLLARLNYARFLSQHGRPALAGEVGCYASHYLVWERCLALNEPIVVMEDDFELGADAVESLAVASQLAEQYPFIRLEDTTKKPCVLLWRKGKYQLVRFLKIPQCLTCYQITPEAARAFIQASSEFSYPVDVFIRNQYLHRVPICGLTPPVVIKASQSGMGSMIGDRHRLRGPAWSKLTRGAHRIRNAILNVLTNLHFALTLDRKKSIH